MRLLVRLWREGLCLPARALSASLRLAGGRASQWQAGSGEFPNSPEEIPGRGGTRKRVGIKSWLSWHIKSLSLLYYIVKSFWNPFLKRPSDGGSSAATP